MYFDDYKHFDRFIEKNFSPSEIVRIRKHLTGTHEALRSGTYLVRVINLTQKEAEELIDMGAILYFDVDEFVGETKTEVVYEKFNGVHKYPMDYMQAIKRKVLKGLKEDALDNGTIGDFMSLYGNVDDKYLLDIYVADLDSVMIIINKCLNIKSRSYIFK